MGAPGRADVCRNGHVYLWIDQLGPDDPEPTRKCTICEAERIASVMHYGDINDCVPDGLRINVLDEVLVNVFHGVRVATFEDLTLVTRFYRKRVVKLVDVDTIPPQVLCRATNQQAGP